MDIYTEKSVKLVDRLCIRHSPFSFGVSCRVRLTAFSRHTSLITGYQQPLPLNRLAPIHSSSIRCETNSLAAPPVSSLVSYFYFVLLYCITSPRLSKEVRLLYYLCSFLGLIAELQLFNTECSLSPKSKLRHPKE